MPPDQAQIQAQAQVAAGARSRSSSDKAADQRRSSSRRRRDPRLTDAARRSREDQAASKKVTQPLVNTTAPPRSSTLTPTTAPSDRATADSSRRCATTRSRGDQGHRHDRRRRRHDRQLRRPRGRDLRAAWSLTIAVVVALSFLLLMLAFRSVADPADRRADEPRLDRRRVRRRDRGLRERLGRQRSSAWTARSPIVSFVPLMMFAILFGLSMDYEVFLMTHIREAWERTRDNSRRSSTASPQPVASSRRPR